MQIDVLTLFPEMFAGILSESIIKRAIERDQAAVNLVNFRDYALDNHRSVDDKPYGGGPGMVLMCQPIFDAVEDLLNVGPAADEIVLLSPQGQPWTQQTALELSRKSRLVLIAGHYEGFDERIREHLPTREISIGDYILTGGEIAAMVVMDSVIRLLPGVLGDDQSSADESFSHGMLEYPQYTRPEKYRDWKVPDILLSGHHENIERWRRDQALQRTQRRRPDLWQRRQQEQQQQQ